MRLLTLEVHSGCGHGPQVAKSLSYQLPRYLDTIGVSGSHANMPRCDQNLVFAGYAVASGGGGGDI